MTDQPQQAQTGKYNVLFVDDDKFLADMYGMKFAASGINVQTCLSANDALEALRAGFPADAIVFDLVMPERDGFSFLQALEAEHLGQAAVRIALTNQSDDVEKKKAEELGVDRYIVKASKIPSEVVAEVTAEIERKRKH